MTRSPSRPPVRDRYDRQRERNGQFWRSSLLVDAVMTVVVALGRIWGR